MKPHPHRKLLFLAVAVLGGVAIPVSAAEPRPNVLLIMADDMGFSDIGCYGGEIPTPNIDALARGGLRFTQFYNSARCSPTRAALLTGLLQHQAGMGILAEDPGAEAPANAAPGFIRHLNTNCVTIAEVLGSAGYHTYMAGKWHLGYHDPANWPRQRGFERYYGILAGASSYFRPQGGRGLTLDNTAIPTPTNADYYTTDAFADHAIQFISEQKDDKPFFAYLAFNAPHWPLHARAEDIAKFVGTYANGWDQLRGQRWGKQLALGIVKQEWGLSPRDDGARAWDALTAEQKRELDYRMAVYAAQVHRMDYDIGRVIESLRTQGKLNNTLVIFLSDNGACAEPYNDLGGGKFEDLNDPDKAGAISYGTAWANASGTPYRRYKARLYEGGISTPLIVHWPAGLKARPNSLTETRGYLSDLMPTILELAGAKYPREFNGRTITPVYGRSLASIVQGKSLPQPEWMFWEHYNDRAARKGDWKILGKTGTDKWELYNLATDRTEQHDLAAAKPELVREMAAAWQQWAETHQVVPRTIGGQTESAVKGNKKQSKPRAPLAVGARPESVTRGFGGQLYVTVMNGTEPGDGVIKVVKGDTVAVFATGFDEPKGTTFTGDYLVTTDLKRVWKIDEQGKATVLVDEKDFPQPILYLNAAAAAPDQRGVFVTDMGARDRINGPDGLWPLASAEAAVLPAVGRVYQIALDGKVTLAVDASSEMKCPNGVGVDRQGGLVIGEFFTGNILSSRHGVTRVLNTGFRGADGIEQGADGNIYVSSWTQGKVWRLDHDGKNPELLAEGFQSAADFYLEESAGVMILPDMKAGTLNWIPLNPEKNGEPKE